MLNAQKIFVIGFNKTGTTSIHTLFLSLGLTSYHGSEWRDGHSTALLEKYDCFSDGYPDNLLLLNHLYPEAKYILQVRDLESWVLSRLAHVEMEQQANIYRGPTWDLTVYSVKSWIRERNDYHIEVLDYFSTSAKELLVINFIRDSQAATKICNFIGFKGTYLRPKENVRTSINHDTHLELLRQSMSELELSQNELTYDILCPGLLLKSDRFYPCDTSQLALE